MKTLPALLAAHIAQGTTTLAHALKITRNDGQVFAFTSASEDVTISGVLHRAAPCLDISSLTITSGLAVDNLELTTLDDGSTFTRADVLSGKWRNAAFLISRFNWAAPTQGTDPLMAGTLGNVELRQGFIVAELRGLQQYLQQPIGNVSSKTCRARLGDTLCTVNLVANTAIGTITSVASNQVFADLALTGGSSGDASFANVSLLLHGDGTNGSTTFTDNGPTPKTVTPNGNAQISTAQSVFGGASMLFDGNGDFLEVPYSADFNFPADFTIEFRVRFAGYSASYSGAYGAAIVSRYQGAIATDRGWQIRINGTASAYNTINIYTGITDLYITGLSFALNTWYPIEISRTAGVIRAFVNGTQVGSNISNADLFTHGINNTLRVGSLDDAVYKFYLNGYLEELRITKGVGRHTANFTPAIAAFPNSAPTVGSYAADWFTEGIITFTSGACAGLSQKIKGYAALDGTITLSLPMLQTIAVGDSYSAIAGCRKRQAEDCAAKFNNVLNFQGEPHLPGIDALTKPTV